MAISCGAGNELDKAAANGRRVSLKSQMVNAGESIAFNIVEGCGSRSPKEFARFLDISTKSTLEL